MRLQGVLRKKLKKFWEKSEKNTLAQCKAKIWQNTADIHKAVRAGHTRTARKILKMQNSTLTQ
jgi:hypothetical protein